MAINTLAMATKMTEALDKAIVQNAVTGVFADGTMKAQFIGAKTVKIPSLNMDGLGNYDRDNGFVGGALSVTQETFTLTMDRGRTFQLDREDNDEVAVGDLAGQMMGEFVRTQVVPEVDAYALSKLAAMAVTKSHTVTVGSGSTLAADAYKMWQSALLGVQQATGFNGEQLLAFVDPTFWAALNNSSAVSRQIVVSDFAKGGVTTQVKKLDNVVLLPVDPARMKTAYTFYDGETDTSATDGGTNQKPGGFVATSSAKSVGLLLCSRKVGELVKKTEKMRIFAPDQNQKADAYKFDYRLYYDFLIRKNRANQVYAYTY